MIAEHVTYSTRHGGPWDRGTADAWYGREFNPHYFVGNTYNSTRLDRVDMSAHEIAAYTVGYGDTEFNGKGN